MPSHCDKLEAPQRLLANRAVGTACMFEEKVAQTCIADVGDNRNDFSCPSSLSEGVCVDESNKLCPLAIASAPYRAHVHAPNRSAKRPKEEVERVFVGKSFTEESSIPQHFTTNHLIEDKTTDVHGIHEDGGHVYNRTNDCRSCCAAKQYKYIHLLRFFR